MTPQDPIQEWQQHDPFVRASKDLIQRVREAMRQQSKPEDEEALV